MNLIHKIATLSLVLLSTCVIADPLVYMPPKEITCTHLSDRNAYFKIQCEGFNKLYLVEGDLDTRMPLNTPIKFTFLNAQGETGPDAASFFNYKSAQGYTIYINTSYLEIPNVSDPHWVQYQGSSTYLCKDPNAQCPITHLPLANTRK